MTLCVIQNTRQTNKYTSDQQYSLRCSPNKPNGESAGQTLYIELWGYLLFIYWLLFYCWAGFISLSLLFLPPLVVICHVVMFSY